MASSSWYAPIEHDFFRMEQEALPPIPTLTETQHLRSFKDMLSKLNPDVMKSVIASTAGDPIPNVCFGKEKQPAKQPASPATMTIFFNGTVSVFEVPQHYGENILQQLNQQGFSKRFNTDESSAEEQRDLLQCHAEGGADLPMARRKSLRHFLEKRSQRLAETSSTYGCLIPTDAGSSAHNNTSLSLALHPTR